MKGPRKTKSAKQNLSVAHRYQAILLYPLSSHDGYEKRFCLSEKGQRTSTKKIPHSHKRPRPHTNLIPTSRDDVDLEVTSTQIGEWIDARVEKEVHVSGTPSVGITLKATVDMLPKILGEEMTTVTQAFDKCPRCKYTLLDKVEKQTRSIDEPMTIFYTCMNPKCNKRWKC